MTHRFNLCTSHKKIGLEMCRGDVKIARGMKKEYKPAPKFLPKGLCLSLFINDFSFPPSSK